MSVDEPFDWDEANIEHLARHGITPREAEEVVNSKPIPLGVELRNGELRRTELGQTNDGRLLLILTTARAHRIRVVTGWPASRQLREDWLRARGR